MHLAWNASVVGSALRLEALHISHKLEVVTQHMVDRTQLQ